MLKRFGSDVIGVDEVGRGCLAGPVVACASLISIFPENVNDSKKLSHKKRQEIYQKLISNNNVFSFGIVDNQEIDRINILEATKKAMVIAVHDLLKKLTNTTNKVSRVVVDGNFVPTGIQNAESVIGGDGLFLEIAASSILAKEFRDNLMRNIHSRFPMYNFAKNVGYGTKEHFEAIRLHGISEYHRRSFLKRVL